MFGIPYVVTVHGGDIDKMAAKSQRIADMTKKILQQAESVIVVGDKLREDVINNFEVPETNVHVMSMGVDTSVFNYVAKVEAREKSCPSYRRENIDLCRKCDSSKRSS